MESLAYLHLALAYEAPVDASPSLVLSNLKLFEKLNQQKLSGRQNIYLLSVLVLLAVLGLASGALAVLKQGDRGPEVTAVQKRLKRLGYFNAGVTGNFGSQTKDAVSRFQQDNGLTPDGVVGNETEAALFGSGRQRGSESYNPDSYRGSVGQQESDESVRYLQQQLRDKGFYSGPIDGINGEETKRAVREFQETGGLRVDGIAGQNTRLALDSYQGRGSTGQRDKPEYTYEAPQRDRVVYRTDDNPRRPYVVVVPGDYKKLRDVRLYGYSKAYLDKAKQGSFVNAGAFSNRARAESRSQELRANGFDARVVYFR